MDGMAVVAVRNHKAADILDSSWRRLLQVDSGAC